MLKTDDRVFIDFAINWFCLQFICHKKNVFKQREIVEKIIFLMGANDQTVKNALAFLCKMVTQEEERQCLVPHCNHLRILLEKMDNLGLEEVGTLNDLLQNLCINSSSISDSLRDDLFILLQKQLSNFKPLYVLMKYAHISNQIKFEVIKPIFKYFYIPILGQSVKVSWQQLWQ